MNLSETLTAIAVQIKCDASELINYAKEDNLGGYHFNAGLRTFPAGSVWGVEGQILYALVRHLKPEKVVEIGGWAGGSTSHLSLAIKANGIGHVYSIDDGSEFSDFEHGYLIPEDLRQYVTLIKDDGRVWLNKQEHQSIGLLFDDASHAASLIVELTRLAMQKIYPTGLLVNHDAMHDQAYLGDGSVIASGLGRQVRDALASAGLYFTPYLTEPSDCGLAITVVPGIRNLDKHSEPKATEESINNKANQEQSVEEYFSKHPEVKKQLDAMAQIGNANIESVSEPPPPLQAQEEQTVDKPVEKKPRGKGRKKAQ